MHRITILTLFPEMFESLKHSIIKRALDNNWFEINVVDIREFSKDIHKKCDDYPYGGGAGMVMMLQPIVDAYKSLKIENSKFIYASPRGKIFNQKMAQEFSKYDDIVILCGHYEGVDDRVIDILGAEEVSIGDYVLTGGELPAMVMVDAIVRNIEGVINEKSLEDESFSNGLLEYPQYTRPEVYEKISVPDVLLSGDHKKIDDWRFKQSLEITKQNRIDLFNKFVVNNFKLVKAKERDYETLCNYKRQSIFVFDDVPKQDYDKINNYLKTSFKKLIKYFQMIKIKDITIGCVGVRVFEDGVLLDEIWVDSDYRGNGIGSKIIKDILDKHNKVYLWVYKKNTKAFNLYKRLGFEIKEETNSRYKMLFEK